MEFWVYFCVFWFFISSGQTSVFPKIPKVWDRTRTDKGKTYEVGQTEHHPLVTEVFEVPDKKSSEREREWDSEDPDFDPTVVIVDTPEYPSTSNPKSPWPDKGLFDEIFGRFPGFGIEERIKPWWKGPNICVERKEIIEGPSVNESFIFSFVHSSCEERDGTYTCTKRVRNSGEDKTYIEKKQCCYGYKLNRNKCEELDLKDLVSTMKTLGGTHFVKMLSSVNLLEKINKNNLTVFCPTDEAITDFEEDDESNKIPEGRVVREASLAMVTASHVIEGYLRSGDITNNQLLPSINDDIKIRINLYYGLSGRIVTANCVRIIKPDNYATNGVVHMIERMLPLPSKTVADIVSSNPQLSILKGFLSQANLVQTLKDANGNFTLFAPTDAAFKNGKFDSSLLKKLQDGKGCVSAVVKNHIISSVVCTSAISVAAQVRNMLDEKLILKRNDDEKLFVNNAQVISHDIVGTNGIVHIIDDVLMPEEAKTLTQALESAKMNDLMELFEKAGMKEEFDDFKNFTFFAPKPSAVKELLNTMSDDPEKKNQARDIINLHFTPAKIKSCGFENNQLLPSKADVMLRVNKYEIFPGIASKITIQCAPIISDNNNICEGTVHYIDRVLVPNKNNILQELQETNGVSKFFHLLNQSGLTGTLEKEGPFTVLAPTDDAFEKMHHKDILEDKEKLRKLIKMHILPEMLCCAGVGHGGGLFFRQYARTLEGNSFGIHRAHHGIRFSNSRTLECDHVATNGVIHVLNKVIEPRRQRPLFVSLSEIFDF